MPKFTKPFIFEISPEQYLDACTSNELAAIDKFIQSAKYRARINSDNNDEPAEEATPNGLTIGEHYIEALQEMAHAGILIPEEDLFLSKKGTILIKLYSAHAKYLSFQKKKKEPCFNVATILNDIKKHPGYVDTTKRFVSDKVMAGTWFIELDNKKAKLDIKKA